MDEQVFFTPDEHKQLIALYKRLLQLSGDTLQKNDCCNLKKHLVKVMSAGSIPRNAFGMNPIIKDMQTAVIVAEEIGMRRASIPGIMLHESVKYTILRKIALLASSFKSLWQRICLQLPH